MLIVYDTGHIIGAVVLVFPAETACNPNREHTMEMSSFVFIRLMSFSYLRKYRIKNRHQRKTSFIGLIFL